MSPGFFVPFYRKNIMEMNEREDLRQWNDLMILWKWRDVYELDSDSGISAAISGSGKTDSEAWGHGDHPFPLGGADLFGDPIF